MKKYFDPACPVGNLSWCILGALFFGFVGTIPGNEIGIFLCYVCAVCGLIDVLIIATGHSDFYFPSDQDLDDKIKANESIDRIRKRGRK